MWLDLLMMFHPFLRCSFKRQKVTDIRFLMLSEAITQLTFLQQKSIGIQHKYMSAIMFYLKKRPLQRLLFTLMNYII